MRRSGPICATTPEHCTAAWPAVLSEDRPLMRRVIVDKTVTFQGLAISRDLPPHLTPHSDNALEGRPEALLISSRVLAGILLWHFRSRVAQDPLEFSLDFGQAQFVIFTLGAGLLLRNTQ